MTEQFDTISMDQARRDVQRYVASFGNAHLAIDEIMEFQRNFYALIKDTSTVALTTPKPPFTRIWSAPARLRAWSLSPLESPLRIRAGLLVASWSS